MKGPMSAREQQIEWVKKIQEQGRNLTAWEEQFVEDMQAKLDKEGSDSNLSRKQADVLERIYAEKTP